MSHYLFLQSHFFSESCLSKSLTTYMHIVMLREKVIRSSDPLQKKLWAKHGNQPNFTKCIHLCESDLVAPMVIASFKKIPRSFQARCHGTAGTADLWRFCVMIGEFSKEKCLSKRRKQMLKSKVCYHHLVSFEKRRTDSGNDQNEKGTRWSWS